jgi:hypothetical protein
MTRLVKRRAILVIIEKPGRRIRRFNIEDTIEILEDWRPEGWEEILAKLVYSSQAGANYVGHKFDAGTFINGIEAGASAMLEALEEL